MNRMSRAVTILLFINIVLFVAGALLPQKGDQLVAIGALWYPTNPQFGFWQGVSYMFLHGGVGHIFFNMFALVSFGKILEWEWGSARFLTFYFICGVGAAVIQTGINWYEFQGLHAKLIAAGMSPTAINTLITTGSGQMPADPAVQAVLVQLYGIYASPMIGASGAIYGLLVAFGFLHPNAKLGLMFVPVPVAAKYFIPGLLLLDLFSGVTGFSLFGGSIAHFAHIGGALIGFLLMLLWRKRSQGPTWTDGEFRVN
jgi:membrane associated rhomboid family serine protease